MRAGVRNLSNVESATLMVGVLVLLIGTAAALGGIAWAIPFGVLVFGAFFSLGVWSENRPAAAFVLTVAVVLAAGFHASIRGDQEIARRQDANARENARLHAERAERVRSGECHLVGPGQATHSTGGKYPKLFFTDFVVYECKNGDVFRMPLP